MDCPLWGSGLKPFTERRAAIRPCASDMGMKGAFLLGCDGSGGIGWVIPCQKGISGPSRPARAAGKSLFRETALRKRSIGFSVREKLVLFMGFSS